MDKPIAFLQIILGVIQFAFFVFLIVWTFFIPFKIYQIARDVKRAADLLERGNATARKRSDPLASRALDSLGNE